MISRSILTRAPSPLRNIAGLSYANDAEAYTHIDGIENIGADRFEGMFDFDYMEYLNFINCAKTSFLHEQKVSIAVFNECFRAFIYELFELKPSKTSKNHDMAKTKW